jgi:hypothetical protein
LAALSPENDILIDEEEEEGEGVDKEHHHHYYPHPFPKCSATIAPVASLSLLGAAVPTTALVHEFPRAHIRATHISNYYSTLDPVLSSRGFSLAERVVASRYSSPGGGSGMTSVFKNLFNFNKTNYQEEKEDGEKSVKQVAPSFLAMGARGMRLPPSHGDQLEESENEDDDRDRDKDSIKAVKKEEAQHGLRDIDISAEVQAHSIHAYLASPRFRDGFVHTLLRESKNI